MDIQFMFRNDGLCVPSEKGPHAKKAFLRFGFDVYINSRLCANVQGLRVGAGRVMDACGKMGQKYVPIVKVDSDEFSQEVAPIFERWAQEFPTVEFPTGPSSTLKPAVNGIWSGSTPAPVVAQALDSKSSPALPARPRRPFPSETAIHKMSFGSFPLLEAGETYRIIQAYEAYHFGCACTKEADWPFLDSNATKSLDQFAARICPRCKADKSGETLRYGIDAEGKLINRLT